MALADVSAKRSLLSYARVQRVISSLIRNKRLFFSKKSATAERLNIGCGEHPLAHMVNLDWRWMPGVDVCADLRKPLPFADNRFKAIYSEHCIDGLPARFFVPNLREMYRVMAPGGTLRLIFCDSELYINAYVAHRDTGVPMLHMEGWGATTALGTLDRVFHHWTHKTLVDFDSLSKHLREAGFREITRCSFRQGRDPQLLHDKESRRAESLYVEAVK